MRILPSVFAVALFLTSSIASAQSETQSQTGNETVSGSIEAIVDEQGRLKFVLHPDPGTNWDKIGNYGKLFEKFFIGEGAMPASGNYLLGLESDEIYQWSLGTGKPVAYFSPDVDEKTFAKFFRALEPGQKIEKVKMPQTLNRPSIPVSREEFESALQKELLNLAQRSACSQPVVPTSISVSISLSAGVDFFVSGEGAIEVSATWDTSQLC